MVSSSPDGLENLDAIAGEKPPRSESRARYHVAVDRDGDAPAGQPEDLDETGHGTSCGDGARLAVHE